MSITEKIISEVEEYIKAGPKGHKFDLIQASATYKTIDRVDGERPKAERARITRSILSKVNAADGEFKNVTIAYKRRKNGTLVLDKSVNHGTQFIII